MRLLKSETIIVCGWPIGGLAGSSMNCGYTHATYRRSYYGALTGNQTKPAN